MPSQVNRFGRIFFECVPQTAVPTPEHTGANAHGPLERPNRPLTWAQRRLRQTEPSPQFRRQKPRPTDPGTRHLRNRPILPAKLNILRAIVEGTPRDMVDIKSQRTDLPIHADCTPFPPAPKPAIIAP